MILDKHEEYVIEMSVGTMSSIQGYQAEEPDLTVKISSADLEEVTMGKVTFDEQISAGRATLAGDKGVYDQLKTTLVQFDHFFEIMPGAQRGIADEIDDDPLEQDDYYVGE